MFFALCSVRCPFGVLERRLSSHRGPVTIVMAFSLSRGIRVPINGLRDDAGFVARRDHSVCFSFARANAAAFPLTVA